MTSKLWVFFHDSSSPSTGPLLRHYHFAKHLHKYGVDTTIFASNRIHSTNSVIPIEEGYFNYTREDGEKYVRIKTTKYKGNGLSRILNWLSFYLRLFPTTRMIQQKDGTPDVILGTSVHPLSCLAAIQIAKRYRVPAIVEIRDLWPEAIFEFGIVKERSILGKILLKGEYWLYRKADALIFTKEGDVDHILEMGWDIQQGGKINLEKCFYINNGVDLEEYHNLKEIKALPDNSILENDSIFKVVYTGSIRPMNNIDLIVDAAIILKEYKDINFLIYGEGNQKKRLESRIKQENIDNVHMMGFVKKASIPYILSRSSVNLLNYSSNYGWKRGNSSNKLFEYMASGRPIISTVQMGYDPLSKYRCGISLDNTTPEELAKKILIIKNMDKEEYKVMSDNAIKGAEDFDFKLLARKMYEVITSTISKYKQGKSI